MKAKPIPLLIALAISALIAYALYSFCVTTDNQMLLAIGGGVMSACTLGTLLGFSFEPDRTSVNIKTLSATFFFLSLVSNTVFAFLQFSVPTYIVTNGILLLTWLILAYSIGKVRQ